MLRVINTGEEGIAYFEESYWGYIDFMERFKCSGKPVLTAYTYLPSDYEMYSSVDKFQYGGRYDGDSMICCREREVFNRSVMPLHGVLSEWIDAYMESRPQSVCYFNEFIHTKSSIKSDMERCTVDIDWKSNYICMGESMVYYLRCGEQGIQEIIDTICYAGTAGIPFFSGFISDYIPNGQVAKEEEIDRIFKGTSIIFAGVYDAEGVMIGEMQEGLFLETFDRLGIPYTLEMMEAGMK